MIMRRTFLLVLSLIAVMFCGRAGNLPEAEIRVRGIGDFCDPGLHSRIAGTFLQKGAGAPDIILQKSKLYGLGCLWYSFVKYDEGIPVFKLSGEVALPKEAAGCTVQFRQKESDLYAFWVVKTGKLYAALRSGGEKTFRILKTWPTPAGVSLGALLPDISGNGTIDLYFTEHDKTSIRPGDWRSADYRPYDATGVFRGGLSACSLWHASCSLDGDVISEAVRISEPEAIPGDVSGMDCLELEGRKGIFVGNQHGGFYWFILTPDGKAVKTRIVDAKDNAMRHPTVTPMPVAYVQKNAIGVLAIGEGGVFYMKYVKPSAKEGKYTFEDPVSARELNPALNAGGLVTPTIVDWDGDGKLDLVVGNSAGFILFFRNTGSDRAPSFGRPEYLTTDGRPIHIQPGYGEDVQGPSESRWGYIGANVYDWNEDGILDILTNDSRGKHSVFLGSKDGLQAEHPIYLGDLALHGTWRCRPGVGKLAGRTVYITLDDDDEFHLYFREDDYDLIEGYKLRLEDGRTICANWLEAGGKGRVRFDIVDWDGDGVKDLIIATNKHNRIPAQDEDGLPWGLPDKLKGATILFMRNVGTEAAPAYKKPAQLRYKGELLRFGHHACGASAGYIGKITDGLPNLVVGDETGTLYLLERRYLSWD